MDITMEKIKLHGINGYLDNQTLTQDIRRIIAKNTTVHQGIPRTTQLITNTKGLSRTNNITRTI